MNRPPASDLLIDEHAIEARLCSLSFERFVRRFWDRVPGATKLVWNWHLSLMCEVLQAAAERVFQGLPAEHDIVINVPPGSSKPVWEGMPVCMADGTWKPLRDVEVGDMVIGKTGRPCRVSAVHKQGALDCLAITTFGGRRVVVERTHPVLTADGWMEAGAVSPGHILALLHRPQIIPSSDRSIDEFRLAGYLIGDGSVSGGNCCLTCKDPEYIDDFKGVADRLGYGVRETVDKNDVHRLALFEVGRKSQRGQGVGKGRGYREQTGPRRWLSDVGLAGLKSRTKKVLDFVWRGTDEQIAAFLASYFHCDGCVSYRHTGKRNLVVSACTISHELALGLQRLFLRLGVSMRIRQRVAKSGFAYNRNLKDYRYYVVETSDQDTAARFLEKIPLKGPKLRKLQGFVSRKRTFDQSYWPDEVESVESAGPLPCRCLTVEDDASFVVDGVVVHNSSIGSILFTAWCWTRMPSMRHLCGSHTSALVLDLSLKCRNVIESELYRAYYPGVELSHDLDTKGHYRNTSGGDRLSCTVSGVSPIGHHFHALVIDDPIDPKGAKSLAELLDARHFMTEIIPSRKIDKKISFTVLIMQRLAHGDPTDVLLEKSRDENSLPVLHICLPGELTHDVKPAHLAERYVDGVLDPHRMPKGLCDRERARMGALAYDTQVLQKPGIAGGSQFKDFYFNKRVKAAPYECRRCRFWDRASTQNGGAYSAGVLLGRSAEGNWYVEDVRHGQWDTEERNARMKAAALEDRRRFGPRHEPTIAVEMEGGSSGVDAWRAIARLLAGFKVVHVKVTGSKDTRAEPWAAQLAAGNVYLVDGGESDGTGRAAWDIHGYVQEHVRFKPDTTIKRLGGFKDQVDGSSGAYNYLITKLGAGRLPMRTYSLKARAKLKGPRFLPCTFDELTSCSVHEPSLLILIHRPDSEGETLPQHACDRVVSTLHLKFGDIDLARVQEFWQEDLSEYGMKPAEAAMTREHGRKLWGFLMRQHPTPYGMVVVAGEERLDAPLSVCQAVCSVLHYDFAEQVLSPPSYSESEALPKEPPNRYVYDMVRASRAGM